MLYTSGPFIKQNGGYCLYYIIFSKIQGSKLHLSVVVIAHIKNIFEMQHTRIVHLLVISIVVLADLVGYLCEYRYKNSALKTSGSTVWWIYLISVWT